MEWYYWLLVGVGVLWVTCAVVNYVLLKKMGYDVTFRGEGVNMWLLCAPLSVIFNVLGYREWKKEYDLDFDLNEAVRLQEQRWKERNL